MPYCLYDDKLPKSACTREFNRCGICPRDKGGVFGSSSSKPRGGPKGQNPPEREPDKKTSLSGVVVGGLAVLFLLSVLGQEGDEKAPPSRRQWPDFPQIPQQSAPTPLAPRIPTAPNAIRYQENIDNKILSIEEDRYNYDIIHIKGRIPTEKNISYVYYEAEDNSIQAIMQDGSVALIFKDISPKMKNYLLRVRGAHFESLTGPYLPFRIGKISVWDEYSQEQDGRLERKSDESTQNIFDRGRDQWAKNFFKDLIALQPADGGSPGNYDGKLFSRPPTAVALWKQEPKVLHVYHTTDFVKNILRVHWQVEGHHTYMAGISENKKAYDVESTFGYMFKYLPQLKSVKFIKHNGDKKLSEKEFPVYRVPLAIGLNEYDPVIHGVGSQLKWQHYEQY